MRVFFCKFQCPFVCFCKSPVPIFSPCSLKLEDTQNGSSSLPPESDGAGPLSDEKAGDEKNGVVEEVAVLPKSSLRKPSSSASKEVAKNARVQWMDSLGRELVEIREFEPSESGESDSELDGHRACVCVIQ